MIRGVQPDDAEFVIRLAHEFDMFGAMYVVTFQGFLQRDPDSFFVSEDDEGRRTGFARVQWDGDTGDIQGVVADPLFRRSGVATELLHHIEGVARARGVITLKCITAETQNPAALNCFARQGFVAGEFCGTYPNGQRAISMSRVLI